MLTWFTKYFVFIIRFRCDCRRFKSITEFQLFPDESPSLWICKMRHNSPLLISIERNARKPLHVEIIFTQRAVASLSLGNCNCPCQLKNRQKHRTNKKTFRTSSPVLCKCSFEKCSKLFETNFVDESFRHRHRRHTKYFNLKSYCLLQKLSIKFEHHRRYRIFILTLKWWPSNWLKN